ncbi:hypothetical protein F9L16_23950 [Agarivorans sp. B2Z047]|uniref:hypothetical protein n=1 Tax=Agarivorans sp. B2Z047 TaxID=2652721 RepID=UPI00128B4D70|nr:hypothetical protein [Agarivorans sp. B2Z047]MPW32001.1 hypothetical protein [Agarivorans sp. B2Z047]UQN43755.1 hypothetical protein LQZ07_04600 [Agarivorans sp. B2Z047]
MLQGKPVFKLELHAYGARYQLDVNGAAAFREHTSANQTTVDLPINHWMHLEQSEIKFLIVPPVTGSHIRITYSSALPPLRLGNNSEG